MKSNRFQCPISCGKPHCSGLEKVADFNDKLSAGILRPAGRDDYIYVVMPCASSCRLDICRELLSFVTAFHAAHTSALWSARSSASLAGKIPRRDGLLVSNPLCTFETSGLLISAAMGHWNSLLILESTMSMAATARERHPLWKRFASFPPCGALGAQRTPS